ncbi:Cysteine synthase [Candidatus Hodgkinia cicadicola]|uniref:Cysteine synthase n=1 Tax=Candidatus Hodgkinia cicadicola TaxID=573658 RepID=A0ABX4MG85_9HYPH|nr:Cysteine synthase [Candidatus Hodgkinia cicadicola]PIM96078.1 Cysteine synthase [Candidatus Hodgkinia cicadicola]
MGIKKVYSSITEVVGNTPIVRLKKIEEKYNIKTQLYAKLEYLNPFGSVKDRIAEALVEDAWKRNNYNKDTIIVEASSGNTGISIAAVAARKGLKCLIVVPESISDERTNMLDLLGANIVFVSEGIEEAIRTAKEFTDQVKNAIMTCQFENKINVNIHKKTTAKEITKSIKNIDYFVSGVGTGGTITGVGEVLKKKNPNTSIVAVEPWKASVLSGKQVKSHGIQGIGVGFLPKILNIKLIDYIFRAKDHEAIEYARIMAKTEGIAVGLSSGAAICAGIKLGEVINNPFKKILIMVPSSAERYMSTELFDNKSQPLSELVELFGHPESDTINNLDDQQKIEQQDPVL